MQPSMVKLALQAYVAQHLWQHQAASRRGEIVAGGGVKKIDSKLSVGRHQYIENMKLMKSVGAG
jgi:hypothetical protein